MPRVKIQVVRPYAEANYGRFVVNGHDIKRARLFIGSLNRIMGYFQRNFPRIHSALRTDEQFASIMQLTAEGRKRFADTGRIDLEQINQDFFRRSIEYKGPDNLLMYLNWVCREAKIGDENIEFCLEGTPEFPKSSIRILQRSTPIDFDKENELEDQMGELGFYLPGTEKFPELPDAHSLKKIYSEDEIYDIIAAAYPGISRHMVTALLANRSDDLIRKIMRPRQVGEGEQGYVLWYRQKIENMVPVFSPGTSGPTLVRESEVSELVAEGRLRPVYGRRNEVTYFTAKAFATWRESGSVTEVTDGKEKRFQETLAIDDAAQQGYFPRRPSLAASQVFLKYLQGRQLTPEAKRSYPLLSAAIEILRASPRGTDPAFEAARIAAEEGLGEKSLAAILLLGEMPGNTWQAENDKFSSFVSFLKNIAYENDIPWSELDVVAGAVPVRIDYLENALNMDIGRVEIKGAQDITNYLQQFLIKLKANGDRERQKEVHLEFFAVVLGKLQQTREEDLIWEEERNLRVALAPMAERCGLSGIAAQIRNEIFRITRPRTFERLKQEVESALGLSYSEAELHLQAVADLLREALLKAGIAPEDFKVTVRVKSPYSAWEKIQTLFKKTKEKITPALLHDLLGISVTVKDDSLPYRSSAAVRQILPVLSPENYNDKNGLLPAMVKRGSDISSDEISDNKTSGFSAITLMRVTELGLPVEVQVTSFERNQRNYSGEAAHWKMKFRREVRHFYPGVELDDFGKLSVLDMAD